MSDDIDVKRIEFPNFHIYRYASVSDDPIIENLRIAWEARDIIDRASDLVDNDKTLSSWNRMNAICIMRNAQRHLLGIDTWEFTFDE